MGTYKNYTTNVRRACELLEQGRLVTISYYRWQEVQHLFGKPTCLRGVFGNKVMIHRYPK